MITMFDSTDLAAFPADPEAVAGYTSGYWPTYPSLVSKFPNAYHLSIAVNASEAARCLDIENFDATPGQAPGWFANHADHSHGKPVLYGSASAVQEIINVMSSAGYARDRYLIWSAHYTYREHICGGCGYPQADATQWTDRAQGRNLDQSLCSDEFFAQAPAPAPAPGPAPSTPTPPEDAEMIAIDKNADGRLIIAAQLDSGEVKHIEQTAPNGDWWKDKNGHYEWLTLGNPGK